MRYINPLHYLSSIAQDTIIAMHLLIKYANKQLHSRSSHRAQFLFTPKWSCELLSSLASIFVSICQFFTFESSYGPLNCIETNFAFCEFSYKLMSTFLIFFNQFDRQLDIQCNIGSYKTRLLQTNERVASTHSVNVPYKMLITKCCYVGVDP